MSLVAAPPSALCSPPPLRPSPLSLPQSPCLHLRSTETGGNNCDADATNDTGCGVKDTRADSFGPAFNAIGGGFFALERTSSELKVWFWPRDGGAIPGDVSAGAGSVDTDGWVRLSPPTIFEPRSEGLSYAGHELTLTRAQGTPVAYYPSTDCDFSTHLGPHNIIINLTFCASLSVFSPPPLISPLNLQAETGRARTRCTLRADAPTRASVRFLSFFY